MKREGGKVERDRVRRNKGQKEEKGGRKRWEERSGGRALWRE